MVLKLNIVEGRIGSKFCHWQQIHLHWEFTQNLRKRKGEMGMLKKSIKQYLSMLLILVMAITNMPMEVMASEGSKSSNSITSSSITSGSIYTITCKQSMKAVEVPEGSWNNGAVLQQWDYGQGENQQWILEQVDNQYYKLVNRATSKVADVKDAATNNGSVVH